MKVWGTLLLIAVGITAFILILSTLANLFIAWSARKYSGKTIGKSLSDLEHMLPGKNCGKCGCKTCAEYAHRVFTYEMETDRCPEASPELSQKMDVYLAEFQKKLVNDTPKKKDMFDR